MVNGEFSKDGNCKLSLRSHLHPPLGPIGLAIATVLAVATPLAIAPSLVVALYSPIERLLASVPPPSLQLLSTASFFLPPHPSPSISSMHGNNLDALEFNVVMPRTMRPKLSRPLA